MNIDRLTGTKKLLLLTAIKSSNLLALADLALTYLTIHYLFCLLLF